MCMSVVKFVVATATITKLCNSRYDRLIAMTKIAFSSTKESSKL